MASIFYGSIDFQRKSYFLENREIIKLSQRVEQGNFVFPLNILSSVSISPNRYNFVEFIDFGRFSKLYVYLV